MSDDNQKFLQKFKDQISTMGKDGILGTDNNNSSLSNANNTINSTFNKNNCTNTKAIFKNSLSDKNTIKKGSAFLKPINNEKINNKKEQCKNNPNEANITKNPYISYPQMNNNNIIYNPSMLYYQYQNPYMFINYNQNQNQNKEGNNNNNNNINYPQQMYTPYQLYNYPNIYFNNNNMNNPNPYIQQNNSNDVKNENINININNGDIKMNKKKKLRPISAQMIARTKSYMNRTNTTINSNYNYGNKSNITTLTNMTSKYEYKPYTLKDYKEIINVDTLGGLGANIGTEEWEKKKEKMEKMAEYSKNIFKKTKTHNNSKIRELDKIIAKNKQKKDELSTRRRANEYSKLIRPKSTGQSKINKQKRYMKDNNLKIIDEKLNENNENNSINNINYLQGKYALIQQKKLNDEKEYNLNNNFNYKQNINNIYRDNNNSNNYINDYYKGKEKENNDKINTKVELKDIFNPEEDDDDEEKKLLEYYNKFKICTDVIINDEKNKENNNYINNEINNDSLEMKNKESNNELNNDSLEIDNNNNSNENKDEEIQIQRDGTDSNIVKKYKTFKEQMNAVNSRSKNINRENNNNIRFNNNNKNKDNNICDEFDNKNEEKNKNKDLEDIQSLLMAREKYLKEVEEIKKGLQQY